MIRRLERSVTSTEEMELAETPGGIEVVHTSHRGEIGESVLSVLIHTEGRAYTFGPVNLRTKEEVPLLRALLKDGYNAKRNRGKRWVQPQYDPEAMRAKSILHPDVVTYSSYIFTVKGMRDHKNGRKKNNYPKRSQVVKVYSPTVNLAFVDVNPATVKVDPASVKVDPATVKVDPLLHFQTTGEMIYPPGHPMHDKK